MAKHDKKSKKSKRSKERKEKRHRRDSESEPESDTDEETRKQRRAHKLARRVEDHLRKHKLTGSGYTDEDNPFGDVRLTERFVWGKKIEQQLARGTDARELGARAEATRHRERLEEAEKVKARQAAREAEREAMQAELEAIARERAAAEAAELERKQERFLLDQAKEKSGTRLREGRAKLIDCWAALCYGLPGVDPAALDPGALLGAGGGAALAALRELTADVEVFRGLDARDPGHAAFWAALVSVTASQLAEAEREEAVDQALARGLPVPEQYTAAEAGWHAGIEHDVRGMLAGKSLDQLAELESRIAARLDAGGDAAGDPEYWQAVLARLAVERARAYLRQAHADAVRRAAAEDMASVDVAAAMRWHEEAGRGTDGREEGEGDEHPEREEPAGNTLGLAAPAATNDEELKHTSEASPQRQVAAADEEEETAAPGSVAAPAPGPAAAPARGEPRAWDDLSEDERGDGAAAAGRGPYSPRPLSAAALQGREAEVVSEEDDLALLRALRVQVTRREAAALAAAGAAAALAPLPPGSGADADRLYRQMVADPKAAASLLGATNPLLRYVTDAAPGTSAAVEPLARVGRSVGGGVETDTAEEARLRATAGAAMGDLGTSGDAPFGGEVVLEGQGYWWHDKYRPRRPKYFNRVHTGYEWNKYNQTHYDGDNPPPKSVQGYKFNIFYPDLIDKAKAPTYKVEADPSAAKGETCILRFCAGPPYEDIAFRVVNKEWEYNHKKGFKSVFDRGILHLYFNFKRQRYRR